ncbi:EAL domain-containing protein [Brevibacillus choshinensis]|uniref:EAL domain-containing protein n=1 Tax=Brevibacillus choshinensis TaxID=54911 RepID=A0ABX7FIK5_BRECH|nr:EAL domain-containing protein [Brevibacillus choshinensis]QRG65517.1 EAL domain-containing protein [Brevibacillus choshinensis]
MESIAKLFQKEEYYHAFQPICDLPGKNRLGYEALLRSKQAVNPEALFQTAKEKNELLELDTRSLQYALLSFFQSPDRCTNELLFVNIFPSTIVEDSFPAFIQGIARDFKPYLNQIVLEINESIMEGKVWNEPVFLERIDELRKAGILIALDDVGEGTTTFRKILEIAPDYIKIDRFFSQNLSESLEKQKVVRLLVEYCKDGAQLILEGVEEEEDFACAASLGVAIGQGYLFGKPGSLLGE